jgi:hypothetical protein
MTPNVLKMAGIRTHDLFAAFATLFCIAIYIISIECCAAIRLSFNPAHQRRSLLFLFRIGLKYIFRIGTLRGPLKASMPNRVFSFSRSVRASAARFVLVQNTKWGKIYQITTKYTKCP